MTTQPSRPLAVRAGRHMVKVNDRCEAFHEMQGGIEGDDRSPGAIARRERTAARPA